MAWYTQGTVTVVNGSNVITGIGTEFVANCRFGDGFIGPDGDWYEVNNIVSNTVFSITPVYAGSNAATQPYKIVPIQGYVKSSADILRNVTLDLTNRLLAIDNLDAAELSYLNGVTSNIQTQLDDKFTGNPAYIANRANHTGTQAQSTVVGLEAALAGKQPLSSILTNSTASFTTTYETKLIGIAAGATVNQTDGHLLARANHTGTQAISTIVNLSTELANKQPVSTVLTLTTASFTSTLESKLNGITAGATVNASDSALRDRATHTGVQAMSTITGLATALSDKQDLLVSGTNIKTINGSSLLAGGDIVIDGDVVLNGIQLLNGKSGEEVNLIPSDIGAATAAQGTKADSALQTATVPADPYIQKIRKLALAAI